MLFTRRLAVVTLVAVSLLSTGCHGGLRNRVRSCWACHGCAPGFEAGYVAAPVGYAPPAAPACSSCYGGDHAGAAAPIFSGPTSPYATPLPVPPGPPNVFQSNEPPAKMPMTDKK